MGSFYGGFGSYKSFLGHCDDGIVYKGSGNSTPIGRYEGGTIYNQFRECVGSYSGGSIYDAFGTHVASYANGSVYNEYLNAAVGREQLGSYDGDPAAAAALVLLFLNNSSKSESTSSGSQSGSARSIGYIIGFIIKSILKYTVGILFNALIFPLYSAITLWGWLLLIFSCTIIPFLLIPVVVLEIVLEICFVPYWRRVNRLKKGKKISKKEFSRLWGMWWLKGPWAYEDLKKFE